MLQLQEQDLNFPVTPALMARALGFSVKTVELMLKSELAEPTMKSLHFLLSCQRVKSVSTSNGLPLLVLVAGDLREQSPFSWRLSCVEGSRIGNLSAEEWSTIDLSFSRGYSSTQSRKGEHLLVVTSRSFALAVYRVGPYSKTEQGTWAPAHQRLIAHVDQRSDEFRPVLVGGDDADADLAFRLIGKRIMTSQRGPTLKVFQQEQ